MKRILLLLISLTSFVESCFAQNKLGNEWITGGGGQRIIFENGSITTNKNHFIFSYFTGGNSAICDTLGHLILASNCYNIYDSLGQLLDGGDTLIPHDYYVYEDGWGEESQGSIFLPIDSEKYYFVTPTFSNARFADCLANNNCYYDLLFYNVIDMKANGGAGKVVQRMIPLMQNAQLRKTQMMACRHSNGKDWWLLKQEGDSANVHKFLFTQDSVYDKGVQVINEPVWGQWDIRGQSTFSSDGSLYATTSHSMGSGLIMLADFDRCYGLLNNPRTIQTPTNSQQDPSNPTATESLAVGLAISPNNRFLYVASICNIYQYDLLDNTWFHVAGIDTSFYWFQNYETMYIGPDGKIYIGNFGGGSKQMSVIDSPDVKGSGCNFCPRCLRLDSLGSTAYVGTPPCMPNYGLGAQVCWPLSTNNVIPVNNVSVYPNPTESVVTVHYNFNSDSRMYIMDLTGRIVRIAQLSASKINVDINLSDLNAGVYTYRIVSNQGTTHTGKIVKE